MFWRYVEKIAHVIGPNIVYWSWQIAVQHRGSFKFFAPNMSLFLHPAASGTCLSKRVIIAPLMSISVSIYK